MDASAAHADHEELTGRLRAAGCVFAEEEAHALLTATDDAASREVLVRRREAGEPLEQVLGWAEIGGVRVAVRPGVFVPRRRTELLARLAADHLAGRRGGGGAGRLVDLCCGAAPVPAVVLAELPDIEVIACDLDPVATAAARQTLAGHPGATVLTGDLFAPLPRTWCGTVDVVSANAPYVPSRALATMPAEARLHEPVAALDGGADGLGVHRRIAAEVAGWLAPGGVLVVELAPDQLEDAVLMYAALGLRAQVHHEPSLDAVAVVVSANSSRAPRPHRLRS